MTIDLRELMTERSATPPSAATARLVQVRRRVRRLKRRRVLSVAGGALMVAAIVVVTAMLAPSATAPPPAASATPSPTAPDLIIVPNVVGLTVAAAEQELTAAHLAWSVVEVDALPPAGVVLSTTVSIDGTVVLRVAKGNLSAVPQLVWLTPPYSLATARAVLATAGFSASVAVIEVPVTDPSLDGKVVEQDPHAGTLADPAVAMVTIGVGVFTPPAP